MREVNVWAICATTGARTTIRNTGRMNRMIGKSILELSFSISDSTLRRRCSRTVSAWSRMMSTSEPPARSD